MNTTNEDILAAPERGSALTGDDAMMDQVTQALRTKGRRKTTISHDVYTFLTWRCLTSPHKGREQWN